MTQLSPEFLDLQVALAGEYSLQRELGRGGMGIVYLARDVQLDRDVAIKILPPHLAHTPESPGPFPPRGPRRPRPRRAPRPRRRHKAPPPPPRAPPRTARPFPPRAPRGGRPLGGNGRAI